MSRGLSKILTLVGTVLFGVMTLAMLVMALVISGQMLVAILLAILFGVLTVFCGYMALQLAGGDDTLDVSGLSQERSRLLRFASSRKGRLTAEEAAMGCNLPVRQAQALLDDLVTQGSADTWVSDGGSLVYVFRGLLEAEEKASAEDPMKFLES